MSNVELITTLLTTIPWLIFLTGWFVRIHMKTKELEKAYTECHKFRIKEESEINAKLDAVKMGIAEIKTDVKWLISNRKSGGPV